MTSNGERYAALEALLNTFIAKSSGNERLQWEITKEAAQAARKLGEAQFATGTKKRSLTVEGIALAKKSASRVAGH